MVSDPGFIPKASSIVQAKQVGVAMPGVGVAGLNPVLCQYFQKILELCEIGAFDNTKFCTTCLVSV